MLLVISDDLESQQHEVKPAAKSKDFGPVGMGESWAEVRGGERQTNGFSVMETVSEFRALRASVVSHWAKTYPTVVGVSSLTLMPQARGGGRFEYLLAPVPEEDTVARLGGDEFTVILTGAQQREDVDHVAQFIIDALVRPFHLAQKSVRISVSIGISRYPYDAGTPVALLQAADQAMYQAKRSGSNRMCFYLR